MSFELLTLPALDDNYIFVLHDQASGDTAVIDVPDAAPVRAALDHRGWTLTDIWLTHHHWDHTDGVADLLATHPAQVTGAAADVHRLPPLDRTVAHGQGFDFAGRPVQVFDVSGHTVGHVAFHLEGHAFTGDSLMALGCGRLFEGTPAQMHESLQRLCALPPETVICSGHEYTASNARFALSIEPDNAALISRAATVDEARRLGRPTVPSTLAQELATNPFLRTGSSEIRARLDMADAPAAEVFAEIRRRKDTF